jgi:hypothetical protein
LDHNGTYNNIVSAFNQATGVFWDTDNENVSYSSSVSAMNLVNAIQIEKAQGPFAVANSYFCYGNLQGVRQRGGFAVRNSEQISLTGTSLYGNLNDQFVVVGNAGGIEIRNWETGQTYNLITQNLSATGNTFGAPSSAVFSDSYLGGADWNTFVSTVKSNNNTFWSGTGSSGFVVPQPRDGTSITLASWQNMTGQDKRSSWTSVTQPSACNIAAESPDFWVTSANFRGAVGAATVNGVATIPVSTFGIGGISGNVALSADGVSVVPGLKASFSATSIPVNGTAVLTLTASPSTPSGTFPITILGNVGNVTHTVTVSLLVQ